MIKTTLKELRNLTKLNNEMIVNATYFTMGDYEKALKEEGFFRQVAYASGVYGCNGMLLIGNKTGKRYVIAGCTQALWLF